MGFELSAAQIATIQIVGAVTAVAGTGFSIAAAKEAQQDQEEAQQVATAQAAEANKKRARRAIMAARADRAVTLARGFSATGGFDNSGIQGGLGAAQTQLASEIGFSRQTQAANALINSNLQSANRNLGKAQTFGAIASLPGQLGIGFGDFLANQGTKIEPKVA